MLNTLKILSKAKDIFIATTRSLTDKQLLLHLLFKQIVLQEGIISCIFNQPFSFILSDNVLKAAVNNAAPKLQSCKLQEYQGLQADLGGIANALKNERFEPQILFKNQDVRPQNLTSVLSGWGGWIVLAVAFRQRSFLRAHKLSLTGVLKPAFRLSSNQLPVFSLHTTSSQ